MYGSPRGPKWTKLKRSRPPTQEQWTEVKEDFRIYTNIKQQQLECIKNTHTHSSLVLAKSWPQFKKGSELIQSGQDLPKMKELINKSWEQFN